MGTRGPQGAGREGQGGGWGSVPSRPDWSGPPSSDVFHKPHPGRAELSVPLEFPVLGR